MIWTKFDTIALAMIVTLDFWRKWREAEQYEAEANQVLSTHAICRPP